MSYQVADIYSDPWAETTLAGTARLVGQPTNPRTETIGAITATQYWVRFSFTEINVLAWVNADNIRTLGDHEQLTVSVIGNSYGYTVLGTGTYIRPGSSHTAGTTWYTYLPCPPMSTHRRLTGYGIYVGQSGFPYPGQVVNMGIVYFNSSNPAAGAASLSRTFFTLTSTDRTRYETILGAPADIDENRSWCIWLNGTVYAGSEGVATYVHLFNPFLLFEPLF